MTRETQALPFPGLERFDDRDLLAAAKIAEELEMPLDCLLNAIYRESAFQTAIKNPKTPHTGLIQFSPETAEALGTSLDELRTMTNREQLVYVGKYYAGVPRKLKTCGDVYLATFMPAALGKPMDFVLGARGESTESLVPGVSLGTVYEQNAALDINEDGAIIVDDIHLAAAESLNVAERRLRDGEAAARVIRWDLPEEKDEGGVGLVELALVLAAGYALAKIADRSDRRRGVAA